MGRNILAILGPSGSGKTDTRNRLLQRDQRFRIIPAYTTRALRSGEIDRIPVTIEEFNARAESGDLLAFGSLYGARYGSSRALIEQTVAAGDIPLLDWSIYLLDELTRQFGRDLFTLYLRPPSIAELAARLNNDGRDPTGARLAAAIEEAAYVEAKGLLARMDQVLVSHQNAQDEITAAAYENFILST